MNRQEFKELIISLLTMTQDEATVFMKNKLLEAYGEDKVNVGEKYIAVSGSIAVALVAHLDTVGHRPPTTREIVSNDRFITQIGASCLGGDDRLGLAMILEIVGRGYRPSIILCQDEEIGGVGATDFTYDYESVGAKFMLELDRRGSNDVCFYTSCGAGDDFKEFIRGFGYLDAYGSFSDISIISPQYKIVACNLSVGYYQQHTPSEYINIDESIMNIERVVKILEASDNVEKFAFNEPTYPSYTRNGGSVKTVGDCLDRWYDIKDDIVESEDTYHYEAENNDNETKVLVDGELVTLEEYYERFFGEQ